ncbi:uncharacterized protein LOC126372797 [Pectinophora gossypiella]|uniref:uncharacterized protein LOC126369426 n=1 Tax=Pectinophora gossypiella TaxID=13191 RepID=UPI00214F05E6|nr:uncharacterized protein LOC126369426 [Pectinophora gossypiella]XP_049871523.1 uncharacterized protein LOC126370605 [Pectinophora gossypiella]XP_049874652.1 uncharacterized protein LOC126372797 [Pectinophora gossypiella]
MSALFGNLGVFDHNTQDWEIFHGRMQQFLILNAANIKEESKSALLLTHLGDDTYRLARNLVHPQALEKASYTELVTALNGHFKAKRSTFADRAKFYGARRSPGESVEEWSARLRGLAIHCDFSSALEMLLKDKFVLGMNPGPERDRLFEQDATTLSFAKAVEVAQQAACARHAREQLQVKPEPVFRVTTRPATGGAPAQASRHHDTALRCGVCGMKNHASDKCKYKNYRCRICGVKGHLSKVCKNKNSIRVNNIDVTADSPMSPQSSPVEEAEPHDCVECQMFNLRLEN